MNADRFPVFVSACIVLASAVLFLQPAPPPPAFRATWLGTSAARIEWSQPAGVHLTCLYRNQTLIRCWQDLPPERSILELGRTGPLDASAHVAAGDIYTLTQDGATQQAPLRGVVWAPLVRG